MFRRTVCRVQRIVVVGNSGAGKSRLGRRIGAALDIPFLELDSIFHLPDWQELPREDFRAAVAEFVTQDAWVVDGNYRSAVGDLLWGRADTVVWLDLSRLVVTRRVVRRTVRRTLTRRELWNGNREPLSNFFRWDPDYSIIRWSWTQHAKYRATYLAAQDDPANSHLRFVRLATPAAVADWVADLTA
jgi:adenylate kinase family enzyme